MSLRNPIYDYAKGIGMVLVIAGHLLPFGGVISSLIYAIHMPLFFYISGIFVRGGYKRLFINYIAPYIFFTVSLFFTILPMRCFWQNENILKSIESTIITIAKLSGSFYICSDHLWFLVTLTLSVIICKFLVDLKSTKQYRLTFDLIILLSLGSIACLLDYYEIKLPFRIQTVPAATMLVYMGNCYGGVVETFIKRMNASFAVIAICAFLLIAYINKTVNMSMAEYNNFMLFLTASICGIVGILRLCSRLHINILKYIGEHSLIIFATHGVWILAYQILTTHLSDGNMPMALFYSIGILFVLFCSVLSYCLLRKPYSIYLNFLKKIMKIT